MDSRKVQDRLLSGDAALMIAYNRSSLKHRMARLLIRARNEKGLTQKDFAEVIGTKQPAIARLENAKQLPSLAFLEKVANVLGTELIDPSFAFLKNPVISKNACSQDLLSNWTFEPSRGYSVSVGKTADRLILNRKG